LLHSVAQKQAMAFLPAAARHYFRRPGVGYADVDGLPPCTSALAWAAAHRDNPAVAAVRRAARSVPHHRTHTSSAPPPPPTAVWYLSPVRRRRGPCCRSEPPPWPLSPASRMDGSWGSGRPICPTPCCVPRSADEAVARGEAVAVIGAASWSGRAIGSHTCVDLPGGSH